MLALPPELSAAILRFLERPNLVPVAATSKILNGVASRALYHHIAFDTPPTAGVILQLLETLARRRDLAELVIHLALDWQSATLPQQRTLTATLAEVLRNLKNVTYLAVPALNDCSAFKDVTLPALCEFHLATWGKFDSAFLRRHPALTRLSLCEGTPWLTPFADPLPQNLEYLRISRAALAVSLLRRLPRGHKAKMKRLDLGVFTSNYEDGKEAVERRKLFAILNKVYPTVTRVNVCGLWSWTLLDDPGLVPLERVTRVGISRDGALRSHTAFCEVLKHMGRVFPNATTLDVLYDSKPLDERMFSYRVIANAVEATQLAVDGIEPAHSLARVDTIVFSETQAYYRARPDMRFEPSPHKVKDYPQIFSPYL